MDHGGGIATDYSTGLSVHGNKPEHGASDLAEKTLPLHLTGPLIIFWLKWLIIPYGLEHGVPLLARRAGDGSIMISRGVLKVGFMVNPVIIKERKIVCYLTQTQQMDSFEECGMMMNTLTDVPLFVKKGFRKYNRCNKCSESQDRDD